MSLQSCSFEVPDRDPYVEAKRIDMTACLEKFYGRHAKWQQNAAWLQNGAKHEKHFGGVMHNHGLLHLLPLI